MQTRRTKGEMLEDLVDAGVVYCDRRPKGLSIDDNCFLRELDYGLQTADPYPYERLVKLWERWCEPAT